SKAGVFTVLLPVAAAVVGVIVLREPFGTPHAAAFVLALLGLLLATWPGTSNDTVQRGVVPP
ncbi:MAG TPA: EamA/RhaT family transporter, partial [Burkholderiaceae bacterium]|nr:EamA/RhaT family transporter [Burkholderiaceae bacterium]